MVSFNCPHCRLALEASEEDDGLTLPCPRCERPVTLYVQNTKQAMAAAVFGGILAGIAAWLGFDD